MQTREYDNVAFFPGKKDSQPGKIDVCSINVRILLGHVFIKTKRGGVDAAGHCFSTHFHPRPREDNACPLLNSFRPLGDVPLPLPNLLIK